ncbi:MAG: hypothetical protein IJY30_03525 [Muribaculaceae bacterium]|nr:hypothetical protein [Muribaculaceae bacterium]
MKTIRILFASVLCLMSMAVVGCSDNDEPETEPLDGSVPPTEFFFYAVDENSDQDSKDYAITTAHNDIKIIYGGKIYSLDTQVDAQVTPSFKREGANLFNFGSWTGKTKKEMFIVDYGNGTQDEVVFSSGGIFNSSDDDNKVWINGDLKIDQGYTQFYLQIRDNKLEPYNIEQAQ